ncbi:Os08g0355500 [Oryza sativa Japonica Group]|uniref:Os08g0355500 protein n=2 Tax=Oryza sativa subsp. japonica TaxID=39947 RepID=Q0J683_ORYSJ|nr:hypothetical protein DAI22_08g127200 [Oryza sativa Japonica Group]BAD03466.1 unknown protein [Oryza sativa Japonica Group]BAF23532.1 Os08g0355500 [Oryza sativa Japonica Group]BAG97520.1 unnamed protein product [Oryza sativa Japonica Group]|eukprot:NP_001061618.1 Os08g0355500 [Oryza sativa Japonica Group]
MAGGRLSCTGWSPAAGGASAHFFLPAAVIVVVLHQLAVWPPPSPHTAADGRRLRLGRRGQAHPDGPRGLGLTAGFIFKDTTQSKSCEAARVKFKEATGLTRRAALH